MIVLVRHPPVIAGGRCYGRLDLPVADPASITELAVRIAASVAPRFQAEQSHLVPSPPFSLSLEEREREKWRVWTSPAQRCRLVAEALGPHCVDDRLQELHFGDWEGLAWDDVPREQLDAWAADPWGFAAPNGETGAMLVSRIRSFVPECRDGSHVIITHGGPLRVLDALLRHTAVDLLAPAPPPGSITLVPNQRTAVESTAALQNCQQR